MKPITIGILQCQKCEHGSKLNIQIEKIEKLNKQSKTYMMQFISVFKENDNAIFNNIYDQIYKLTNEEIVIENDQDMHNYLDNFDVIDGCIQCETCDKNYNIHNGIADFLS